MGKAMKTMKTSMKKKAMKKSVIAKGKRARASVWSGSKSKTYTGLKKGDLMKNKSGKLVTKKSHAAGKKAYKNISKWTKACQAARKQLKIKGFTPVGGKTPNGQN